MDENEEELLRLIYTRIGMLMEDASLIALKLGGPKSGFDQKARDELVRAVETISALSNAAEAMQE